VGALSDLSVVIRGTLNECCSCGGAICVLHNWRLRSSWRLRCLPFR
jgi:hypothetical protein